MDNTAKEPNSAPHSPRGATAPFAAAATARGGRGGGGGGSSVGSSRGGRRQVHARLHARTNSANSLASPDHGSPTGTFAGDFTRGGAGGILFPASPLPHGERNVSIPPVEPPVSHSGSTDDPSTHAPAQDQNDDDEQRKQEQQQREERLAWEQRQRQALARTDARKEAMVSILADPERHRRAVAAGSSNPLHVWGHETSFLKSRYFSSKRREDEPKYTNQTEQAGKFLEETLTPETVPGTGAWSRMSSLQSPNSPNNGITKRLLSDSCGNGGSGGNNNNNDNNVSSSSGSGVLGDYYLPRAPNTLMEKNDVWSTQEHCRTRNMNALHAFSWDQRVFLPQRRGYLSSTFDLFASPRFWEKIDWSLRGVVLTILPVLVLCMEPTTRNIFPLPTSVIFLAYWTTSPTLGAGLRETFVVLKGFSISLVILLVIIAIQPGPAWVTLIILFSCLLVTGFVAEQLKRMVAYCFASLLMQYIAQPQNTGYNYVAKYYSTILIGQSIGLASFLFPYIRWSSENARRYIVITGDAVSLSVHGACCSLWVENSLLERQLHVARLRQLRQTIVASTQKAQQALSEMGYEPHSGIYSARLKTRMAFLRDVFNVVQSMTLVIEQVAANPALVETPMCREFGERIRGELSLIGAAMDSLILRIVDLDNLVSVTDMAAFRLARTRFEEAVSSVRDEVILSNPDYCTDNSDILLGFFLFSVEELMEIVGDFQDAAKPPSNLLYLVTFPLRDLLSSWSAFVDLYNAIRIRRSITRRLKEAIKLSVCIIVAAVFQVYAMKSSSTSPVAGVDIIAFVYRATGGESFQYSTLRMLGTVLGSLTGLLGVQIAQGRRPVMYGITVVLAFVGAYVQAAPEYGALGNALTNSVISMVLSYANEDAAITRIQQNCFAILIYFIISSLIWPVRGRTKVNTGLDVSLRMAREATDRLLCNLDLPDSATAVSADVLAVLGQMQKKVSQQLQNIPGAIAEPTLDSIGFPEMPWRMLISAQRKLLVTLLMMRHAYHTFMTSTIADVAGAADKNAKKVGDNVDMIGAGPAAATSISVHWVVLHRISPYTRQLSQLFYEAIEVYLLTLSKATFVPTAELTRLRLGMMQCYDRIVAVYIETIQHELNESDGDEAQSDDDDADNNFRDGDGEETGNQTANAILRASRKASAGGNSSGNGVGGRGAMALENVAGFVPPPASTFAPAPTTVGGTADSTDTFRNNSSMRGVTNRSMTGLKNSSMRGASSTIPTGSFRRSGSAAGETRASSKKAGGGQFSYKLTPEERQRLREYVLGPSSSGQANASFFANAAALAAAAERANAGALATGAAPEPSNNAGGGGSSGNGHAAPTNAANEANLGNSNPAATALPNQTFAGNFLSNHSMFNMTGSFWNGNVSMFDPALLRNAGILVQEPVHVEPGQQSGPQGDANESGARSTLPSALLNSFMPRRGSGHNRSGRGGSEEDEVDLDATTSGGDGNGAGDASGENNNSVGVGPLTDQLPMQSDDDDDEHNRPTPRHDSSDGGSAHDTPLPRHSMLFRGRGRSPSRPNTQDSPHVEGSNPMGIMKKSKTSKYAVPSVLQMSMVLPAGAYALRNPNSIAAASLVGRESRHPQQSSSLSIVVPSASRLDPPSVLDGANNTASTAATPPAASSSMLARSHNTQPSNNHSFVSSAAGTSAGASGDVFSLGRSARTAVRPAIPWSAAGVSGGRQKASKGGDKPRRDRVAHFADESLRLELPSGDEEEHEAGTEDGRASVRRRRQGSWRADSDAPTAAPSTAQAPVSPTAEGIARAELMSCTSHEPFETEQPAGGGSSAPEQRAGDSVAQRNADTSAFLEAVGTASVMPDTSPAAPDSLLPAPIQQTEEGDRHVSNSSVTRPFFNNSFSAAGPAIPDALRNYVEGLAEQQRQQVPPPPAILGNMSFINIAAPLPVANRSILGGASAMGNVGNGTFAGFSGALGTNNSNSNTNNTNVVQASSSGLSPAAAANTSAVPAQSSAAPPMAPAAYNDALQADFMSAVSKLEFNNGTFCGAFRGADRSGVSSAASPAAGTSAGAEGLMKLLDVGGADSDGNGDEYVLTNSDIHGLEAFLFGLRAIITQVEDLERNLLEVVHGNEMAAKL